MTLSKRPRKAPARPGAAPEARAADPGTPIIAAPGFGDMIDFPTWAPVPERFRDRPYHAHNRLIASVCIDATMRREVAIPAWQWVLPMSSSRICPKGVWIRELISRE